MFEGASMIPPTSRRPDVVMGRVHRKREGGAPQRARDLPRALPFFALFFGVACFAPVEQEVLELWPATSAPTREATLFAPGLVSTGSSERDGSMSAEGDCFAYTLQSGASALIVLMERREDRWQQPEIAPFSGEFTDLEPAFDPRGEQLWFASRRPLAGEQEAGDANLWRVSYARVDGRLVWAEPEELSGINGEGDEYYPSVSLEGELVFTAQRTGGQGGEDLWLAYPEEDPSDIYNAGPGVNTPGPEFNACLRPDGGALVFSSVRVGDQGGGDLYLSERQDDGSFGPARPLTELNSASLDFCPNYSSDGEWFWFSSRRSIDHAGAEPWRSLAAWRAAMNSPGNGEGDIYWVSASALLP